MVLADLADGLPINEALPRHTNDLPALEAQFADFATAQANGLAPETDWSDAELDGLLADDDSEAILRTWVAEHPRNLEGVMTFAAVLQQNEKWDEAEQTLRQAIDLYPGFIGGESPYLSLAGIHQRQGQSEQEAQVLEEYASLDADASASYLRLMELATQREDWESLARNAERLMAVNPLTAHPHRGLARAAEVNGEPEVAIQAYRSLLVMTPDDPADVHFRLASHLDTVGETDAARRHALMALEVAPRFRKAQQLLLQFVEDDVPPEDRPLLPELDADRPAPAADETPAEVSPGF